MYNTKNITFRAYEIDLKQIEKAAKAAKKNVSDYVRDVVIPKAYKDTGDERPDLPELQRGRYGGLVAQAARLAGMSPDQLRKEASENLARAILNAKGAPGGKGPKGGSGVRRSPGAYSSGEGKTKKG